MDFCCFYFPLFCIHWLMAAQSTGRIRVYQSVIGGILLSIVPISYLVLKLGAEPSSVFVGHLFICVFAFIVRLFIIHSMISFPLRSYFYQVLLRCLFVLLLAIPLPIVLLYVLPATLWIGLLVCVVSVVAMLLSSFVIGLTGDEKKFVIMKMKELRKKNFNN